MIEIDLLSLYLNVLFLCRVRIKVNKFNRNTESEEFN